MVRGCDQHLFHTFSFYVHMSSCHLYVTKAFHNTKPSREASFDHVVKIEDEEKTFIYNLLQYIKRVTHVIGRIMVRKCH